MRMGRSKDCLQAPGLLFADDREGRDRERHVGRQDEEESQELLEAVGGHELGRGQLAPVGSACQDLIDELGRELLDLAYGLVGVE